MNQNEALKNYVDAQGEMLTALHNSVTAQSNRINDLMLANEALGRVVEAQSELLSALQAGYDTKIAMIIEELGSLATRES